METLTGAAPHHTNGVQLKTMNQIYVPAQSAEDWRPLLAKPVKHWKTGFSAKTLAHCWQEASGFPPCMKRAFDHSGLEILKHAKLLFAIPEHQVGLPGGTRPTQSDLFALASTPRGLLSITVEGKVDEEFGPLVLEWLKGASAGKRERLRFICETLGLAPRTVNPIRYQLLHRTTAAVLEARRFHARDALMIVHSFSPAHQWHEDYRSFASLFDVVAGVGTVVFARSLAGVDLHLGWAVGDPVFLTK